jgi:hypothetical protein
MKHHIPSQLEIGGSMDDPLNDLELFFRERVRPELIRNDFEAAFFDLLGLHGERFKFRMEIHRDSS